MAYADWTFDGSPGWQGGSDLLGVSHTLAGAGDRLRRCRGDHSAWNVFRSAAFARNELLDPGDSGTIAVSQRLVARYKENTYAAGVPYPTGLTLHAKGYYNSGSLQLGDPSAGGYRMGFGRIAVGPSGPARGSFALRFGIVAGDYSGHFSTIDAATFAPAESTFYPLRFDCIPVSTTKDVLRVYSGSGPVGAEAWTLQIEHVAEAGMGNGWISNAPPVHAYQAYGLGFYQSNYNDANDQMDVHHYRALVKTGGPFPDQE